MTRVLIVDDEERIRDFLTRGLENHGYSTATARNGEEALALLSIGEFDLVLLDVGMPLMDGHEVVRRMRGSALTAPVIMLTARGAIFDIVDGLDAGADDYLVKPFKFDELLARVRARLRAPTTMEPTILARGALELDQRTRRIRTPTGDVDLSAREFALATEFFQHPGQVLSRAQLLSRVWGIDFDPGSNVVDVLVRLLRSKIGADAIETVRGAGYRLR